VTPIAGHPDAFELARVLDGDNVPLELHGTTAHLFVRLVVVVEDGHCRTESSTFRLQTDPSRSSWLIRWEYLRDPPPADYAYPKAHVHVNGVFPGGASIGPLHIPSRRVPLELVAQHLITDWDVQPKNDGWQAILEESIRGFDDRRRVD
jgi:hypothetical protein